MRAAHARLTSLLSLACVLVATAGAFGQAAPPRPADAERDTTEIQAYKLDELVVTVTRSRASLIRLPYAVSLLDASRIQGLERTVSLDESLRLIPGVFVDDRHNFALGNRVSIRGFGARSQFGVRGIRIIQDGIPLTMADGQAQLTNLDLAAAGRVEVVRGPASALYGNASGGVIAVESEEPGSGAIQPELRVSGGGFGNGRTYQKYDLKASGRSGRFDYIAHLGHYDSDGYRLHSRARYTQLNSRLRFYPDSRSTLSAVINYANTPRAENPSSLTDSLARAVPDTARDIVLSPAECPPNPGFGGCQDLGEESEQGQAGLTYRRGLGANQEIVFSGYGLFRKLKNPIPFTLIELDRAAAGLRFEYRFAPASGLFSSLTTGLDVDHLDDDRVERFRDDTGVGDIELDQEERVTSIGAFGSARVPLGQTFELTASARYDRVHFAVDDRLVSASDPDDSGSRTLDQLSPMVGLVFSHTRWLNAYANIGRGFQTPTTTELSDTLGGFNRALEAERSTNYELGMKGSLGGVLSYTLAGFYNEIEGQLIGFEPEGIDRTFFTNAGTSTHKGLEADLAALLAPALELRAAYTFSHFRFDRFVTDGGDFSGNRVPGIPPHQFRAELSYRPRSGPAVVAKATLVDRFYVDNANTQMNDGYATVDLRLAYSLGSRLRVTPFLGIDNLFDVRYNSSVVVNAFGGRFYEPAPGRNVYVGLQMQGS